MYEEKILKILETHKEGLLSRDLRELLNVGSKRRTSYQRALKKLDGKIAKKEIKIIPKEKIKDEKNDIRKYNRKVIYLPKYKEIVDAYWEKQPKEMYNIGCGFLLIRKEFLVESNGAIHHINGFVEYNKFKIMGFLDGLLDIDKTYDYLFFWVENGNCKTIKDIVASIYIPFLFFKPLNNGKCYKCRYNVDNNSIRVICENLMSWEKPLSKDRAYAFIPLERKELDDEYDKEEEIPEITVKYNDTKLKNIKGGELNTNTSKGIPIFFTE